MAAILSATGEKDPNLCWNVNMNGSMNVLDLGVKFNLNRIIIPSSIAVWGKGVDQDNTPQESVLQPSSMYGITKVSGELLADYYVAKYGLDCRGLRYPGIVSSETLPGGGTTDYAVEIFYEAVVDEKTGKRKAFFNLGPKNDWRIILDDKNKEKIEKNFKNEMQELGYLKL